MSTIKVTNLQNASAASPAIVLDANSRATLNGLSYPTEGSLSGRNRIINGAMMISQRGTQTGSPLTGYTLDRWLYNRSGTGSTTVSQSSNISYGSLHALLASSTLAAGEVFSVEQRIEAINCFDLAGKTVTVSFYAAATTTAGSLGSFTCRLSYATATDNWTSDTQIASTSFAITGTPTLFTLQFAVPAAATTGLKLQFNGGQAAATGTLSFYLGTVQLEAGSVATPFERRSYGQELALCQRYYEKSYAINTAPATNTGVGSVIGRFFGSGDPKVHIRFSTAKRAAPTMTFYTPAGSSGLWRSDGSVTADRSVSAQDASEFSVNVAITSTMDQLNGHWVASSEL